MARQTKGEFSRIFGDSNRNKIIEFFLEMRELDFSISDLAKELKFSRATAYNTVEELINKKYIIPTRKSSGAQLYKLNTKNTDVILLLKVFNLIIINVYSGGKR